MPFPRRARATGNRRFPPARPRLRCCCYSSTGASRPRCGPLESPSSVRGGRADNCDDTGFKRAVRAVDLYSFAVPNSVSDEISGETAEEAARTAPPFERTLTCAAVAQSRSAGCPRTDAATRKRGSRDIRSVKRFFRLDCRLFSAYVYLGSSISWQWVIYLRVCLEASTKFRAIFEKWWRHLSEEGERPPRERSKSRNRGKVERFRRAGESVRTTKDDPAISWESSLAKLSCHV